ncbi:homeobox protein BEL1-like protein [Iris pallida]|uniref:Homeobox protein BEL1-like protein n=1 Tax=Iris pallida TaxID=29817 RepID=A0AAX6EVC6_IRIPA|nr:homeobox protein BEL1-like protein [Iris pallida]
MAQESHHDFAYEDFSSASNTRMQSLEPSHEILSLQAGMEMLGLPLKQDSSSTYLEQWRSFATKADTNSSIGQDNFMFGSSEAAAAMTNLWQQQQQQNGMMGDESSLKCLFPVQGDHNQQLSHGLSLSLHNSESYEEDFSSDAARDARFFPETYRFKDSMYMVLAQELLNEFCSIGGGFGSSKHKTRKANQWEEGGSSSSASWNLSLFTMDVLELQKRKAMLLSMLEEVGRKYKRYCDQMSALVSSFEAVAGEGAATVYSTLASKAMSRHFRSLRDGIVSQIQATRKAMGEKDPVVPGITKGETPRLKILDKCIRQQKAFQQAGVMESQPWRPQRGLPEPSVSVLRAWLFEHFLHPYPSDVDKHILSRQTGLSRSQVSNWFINARVRLWKPMVEEMYVEETKEQDNQSFDGTTEHEQKNSGRQSQLLQSTKHNNPRVPSAYEEDDDQEPPLGHLHMNSLSSMINRGSHHLAGSDHGGRQQQQKVSREESFGAVDLDFSSYNNCSGSSGQNVRGNNVSLTLGLQHHTGGGMSLSFSPASQQSIMFSGTQMEVDCQPVHFSIIDGEAQNLPYRNLMGAQLLHDLAG